MKKFKKDKKGLYFQGEFKTASYSDAIKEVFKMSVIPKGFSVNTDQSATGYSVADSTGVQHIYELSHSEFYDSLMNLDL